MTCRACKYEWCWVCDGSWVDHGNHTGGYYKCNKYDPKKKSSGKGAQDEAKAELDRYLHYYQRYHNHDQVMYCYLIAFSILPFLHSF
jgi:ariadne-1